MRSFLFLVILSPIIGFAADGVTINYNFITCSKNGSPILEINRDKFGNMSEVKIIDEDGFPYYRLADLNSETADGKPSLKADLYAVSEDKKLMIVEEEKLTLRPNEINSIDGSDGVGFFKSDQLECNFKMLFE